MKKGDDYIKANSVSRVRDTYEGCSNMNASSFITSSHICYDKLLYLSGRAICRLLKAPNIMKHSLYFSRYRRFKKKAIPVY